jgi:predicted DNA-binding protein (UPF0251 family)
VQPDRDRNWRGWLFRTAQREAWRLNALDRRERECVDFSGKVQEAPDPADHHEQRLEFQAALEELRKLPPRLQQVVLVNSQVYKQADVAEIHGVSRPRVAQLLVEAALKVAALNEERRAAERPVAVPRAARLRELEQDPPPWLAGQSARCRNARSPRPASCWPGGARRWRSTTTGEWPAIKTHSCL